MYLIKVHRSVFKIKDLRVRYNSRPAIQNDEEYSDTPQYPPILDLSHKARTLRYRDARSEKLKSIKTVEEKQIGLNMPKYYGFKCIIFKEDSVPFNAMPLVQSFTRTHFTPITKLPDVYLESETTAREIVKEIKSQIEDAISLELEGITRQFEALLGKPVKQQHENAIAKNIVRQINRIIMNSVSDRATHLLSSQVDYDPRHEAFWFVGGVDPPKSVMSNRRKHSYLKDTVDEPVNRHVQYKGTPILTVRSNLPLKPILEYSEASNPSFAVPKVTYHPETVGYYTHHQHGTNIPGYWPGDTDEFGLVSIHGRGHILDRKQSFGEQDDLEALHCQAMKANYGWLLAQANFQGFTTFNDITYPLVNQSIITNGQLWSFYVYQLNTILMHNHHMDENPKYNICFGTQPLRLYEAIENGKTVGFNEDVLKIIVQFYLNAPEERDYEMKPYLGEEEKFVADIEDDKRRIWLENRYKNLVSNRPRHRLVPEVYNWEYIYKIVHKTRPMDKKRRPFELGINPFSRRLDEHLPQYIPKVLRPYPRCRKKFEDTYYPDVKV